MPPGAQRISKAGEKGNTIGHHEGFGPNQLCGELPKISGE
jgi:hypothetical protein